MQIVIIGGVAGGMACATRLRRLEETAQITVIEKGAYPSFSNCGLPYYLGGVIPERSGLFAASKEMLEQRYALRILTETEAVAIDRDTHHVTVQDKDGVRQELFYDRLILSPGAEPVLPNFASQLKGVFLVHTVDDVDAITAYIREHHPARALVVGGGFIGLECAENLSRRGLQITLLEGSRQLMPQYDPDMVRYVDQIMLKHGVNVIKGQSLFNLQYQGGSIRAMLADYTALETDLVILSIGIRPRSALAKACGLELSASGHIVTDEQMQTSDSCIYALGDAAALKNRLTGEISSLALAGPISKQVRAICGSILGNPKPYAGFLGVSGLSLFGYEIAKCGLSEAEACERYGDDCQVVWTHPGFRVGFLPGTTPVHFKLIFNRRTEVLLGACAVGRQGACKAIEGVADVMALGGRVSDLASREHCYAPPFSAARDVVCMTGAVAQNVCDGLMQVARFDELKTRFKDALLIDVREQAEIEAMPPAEGEFIHIPLDSLRARLKELPKDRTLVVTCRVGARAYVACRILQAYGFRQVYTLSGGVLTLNAVL
ncbi:MAG: FAD-dependent oxidoreductase [Succinivibrio sp.]|nr:FAD-dependent oxidoreductase [Succinivibrio sp.]